MDKIEAIEEQLKLLADIVRGVLSAFTVFAVYRIVNILSYGEKWERIYEDVLKGQPLPKLTELIFTNGSLLTALAIGIGLISVVAAYMVKNKAWPLILLACSCVGLMILHQIFFRGLSQPAFKIIENLGG